MPPISRQPNKPQHTNHNNENQTKTKQCLSNQKLPSDPTLESSSKAFSRRSGLIRSSTKLSADAIFGSFFIWASAGLATEELELPKTAFLDSDSNGFNMVGDTQIEGPSLYFLILKLSFTFFAVSPFFLFSRECEIASICWQAKATCFSCMEGVIPSKLQYFFSLVWI